MLFQHTVCCHVAVPLCKGVWEPELSGAGCSVPLRKRAIWKLGDSWQSLLQIKRLNMNLEKTNRNEQYKLYTDGARIGKEVGGVTGP